MTQKRPSPFSFTIRSEAEALKIIKDTTLAYYVLAVVLVIIALLTGNMVWIDAIIYALLSFWLGRFQSRIAVGLLLLLAIIVFIATLINLPGANIQGRNALVGLFMLWTSSRAFTATLKLQRGFGAKPEEQESV